MSEINLLTSIYFQEQNEEGLAILRSLLKGGGDTPVVLFAGGTKQQHPAEDLNKRAVSFNLVQGTVVGHEERIDFRYRPAASSKNWRPLQAPDPTDVYTEEQHEVFQLFLALTKFGSPGLSPEIRVAAVLEMLCFSVTASETLERRSRRWLE